MCERFHRSLGIISQILHKSIDRCDIASNAATSPQGTSLTNQGGIQNNGAGAVRLVLYGKDFMISQFDVARQDDALAVAQSINLLGNLSESCKW